MLNETFSVIFKQRVIVRNVRLTNATQNAHFDVLLASHTWIGTGAFHTCKFVIFLRHFEEFCESLKGANRDQEVRLQLLQQKCDNGYVSQCLKIKEMRPFSRYLKITEKVSFNIASEASYVYMLSGQKLIKNAKNCPFW